MSSNLTQPAKLLLLVSLLSKDRIISNNGKAFIKDLILRRDPRLNELIEKFELKDSNDMSFLELVHNLISDESKVLYNEIFADTSVEVGKALSKSERERKNLNEEKSLIYGEVEFDSFYRVLRKINPAPGLTFYDLGSGTGKAIFIARLTQDFNKCVGIEILSSLHKQANTIVNRFNEQFRDHLTLGQSQYVNVYEGSFLDFDWSDGDVVFANSTCFSDELMISLSEQAEQLKPGAIVVTFTKGMTSKQFELLERKRYRMSWGPATVFIHRKLNPNGNSVGPARLNILPSDAVTYYEEEPPTNYFNGKRGEKDEEESEEEEEDDIDVTFADVYGQKATEKFYQKYGTGVVEEEEEEEEEGDSDDGDDEEEDDEEEEEEDEDYVEDDAEELRIPNNDEEDSSDENSGEEEDESGSSGSDSEDDVESEEDDEEENTQDDEEEKDLPTPYFVTFDGQKIPYVSEFQKTSQPPFYPSPSRTAGGNGGLGSATSPVKAYRSPVTSSATANAYASTGHSTGHTGQTPPSYVSPQRMVFVKQTTPTTTTATAPSSSGMKKSPNGLGSSLGSAGSPVGNMVFSPTKTTSAGTAGTPSSSHHQTGISPKSAGKTPTSAKIYPVLSVSSPITTSGFVDAQSEFSMINSPLDTALLMRKRAVGHPHTTAYTSPNNQSFSPTSKE